VSAVTSDCVALLLELFVLQINVTCTGTEIEFKIILMSKLEIMNYFHNENKSKIVFQSKIRH